MPKLNLGKVVGDKGDPFVFEDFTSEQLDGLTPKMIKGNVTTLDPDQNATVDIRKEGLNNYIDFGIPRGKNGSEIKSISAENVEMADGSTLENTMTAANESIAGIEEPVFDDAVDTYATLAESNTAAETTSNAIQSRTSIFSTLSNMKKSLSAIVQGLKILGKNVGMIDGITSDLNSGTEYTAASIKAVSALNSNLNYSRFRIDNTEISVAQGTESVLPIKTVINNADPNNCAVGANGTISISKAGIYFAFAKVHGSFRTGCSGVFKMSVSGIYFSEHLSNGSDISVQFQNTVSGAFLVTEKAILKLSISSEVGQINVYPASISPYTEVVIVRIK